MRLILTLTIGLLSLSAISCGPDKSADKSSDKPTDSQSQIAPSPSATPKQTAAAVPSVGNSDTPVPPKDAQWTIYCTVLEGPGHVERAKQLKDELAKSTKFKSWYVVHEEQLSTLYYGYYNDSSDAKLKSDRQSIRAMQDGAGNHPFGGALPVSVTSPDPTAPPELNLLNAHGYWSLQVGVYQGAGRKAAAVDAVKLARKMGEEAYYYHGPNVSAVCIGTWPEQAVRKQDTDGTDGVNASNREQPLLVLGPGANLPDAMKQQNLYDKDTGKPIQVLEQKVEPVDPTLLAAMAKYPTYSVNGMEDVLQVRDPQSGKMITAPKPSIIVPIPHDTSALQSEPPPPGMLAPLPPPQTGTGRLRSVDQP